MALPDLIKSLIAGPITKVFGPFRAEVLVASMIDQGETGPVHDTPVPRLALVDLTSEQVMSQDGTVSVSKAKFTFFEAFGIKEGDEITLNGKVSRVVKVGGLLDPDGEPYIPEAWTG